MRQKIILKLGGSILTKKDTKDFPLSIEEIKRRADEYIRASDIKRIGRELKGVLNKKPLQLILVNGVGPFGHFLVKHKRPDEEVRASVRILNDKLISELRLAGLDVVPIPPSESAKFADEKFDISYLWSVAEMLLEEGKIPSTYGDMLEGGKIISGDDLVVLLAERWQADRIVVATDVDGVFTKDPKIHKDAKFIRFLSGGSKSEDEYGISYEISYGISVTDVTGGMESKVEKLKRAAKLGIKSQIVNGSKAGIMEATLLGDEKKGTLILP